MVDFRYHLVSIIAVFLALAVGIVVGTTALNGPVLDGLKGSISRLTTDKRTLETNVKELRGTVADDSAFADLVAPALVRDQLADQRVLVISTSDAVGSQRDDLVDSLKAAGATVSGRLRLRPDLTDPAKAATVEAVVTGAAPPQLQLPQGSAVERAAAELAALLVRSTSAGSSPTASTPTGSSSPTASTPSSSSPTGGTLAGGIPSAGSAQEVLSAFTGADLLDVESDTVEPTATLVLLVTGPVPDRPSADQLARRPGDLALVDAFDARTGLVVVGPTGSADADGLLRALRGGARADRVTTVDDADRGQGRVAAVLALREQAAGGAGRYGTGRGAQATAPSPAR